MKLKKSFIIITLILPFFFLISCSSDESNPTENDPPEENIPEVTIRQFDIPAKLQAAADTNNFGASQAVAMLEMINGIQELADDMMPPDDASKIAKVSSTNASRTFSLVMDGVTMKWDFFWDSSTIELYLTYNGTRGSDGKKFAEFEKGYLIALADGSYFTYVVHDDYGGKDHLDIEMEKQSNGDYMVTYDFMGILSNFFIITTDGTMVMRYEFSLGGSIDMKIFPDGSGEYDYFDAEGNWIEHGTW